MKKSELKKIIGECINEVESDKLWKEMLEKIEDVNNSIRKLVEDEGK